MRYLNSCNRRFPPLFPNDLRFSHEIARYIIR